MRQHLANLSLDVRQALGQLAHHRMRTALTLLLLAPLAVGLWWLVTKVTGKAALGSVVAAALVPIGLVVLDKPAWEFVAVAGLCALIVVKHAGNIKRLIRREEHALSKN